MPEFFLPNVERADNVMIGGFILASGNTSEKILIRGIGPSLAGSGVPNALADPTLELHNGNGITVAFNDNWRDTQEAEIEATGIAPTDDLESAVLGRFAPGAYTAIVRGGGGTTGIGLVEAYQLSGAATTPDRRAPSLIGRAR